MFCGGKFIANGWSENTTRLMLGVTRGHQNRRTPRILRSRIKSPSLPSAASPNQIQPRWSYTRDWVMRPAPGCWDCDMRRWPPLARVWKLASTCFVVWNWTQAWQTPTWAWDFTTIMWIHFQGWPKCCDFLWASPAEIKALACTNWR